MADAPFEVCVLFGLILEALFYGVYIILFAATIYVLFIPSQQGHRESVNKLLLVTACLLCMSLTLHFCINCARIYAAYVIHIGDTNGPAEFLTKLDAPLALVWASCYVFEAFLADSLTIYRLYVIWGNNLWVCIPPALSVLGMFITGIGCVVAFARMTGADLWSNVAGRWLLCSFVMGLATNILAVGLIGYRIIRRNRKIKRIGGGSLMNVMIVIIESAALYSLVKLVNLILLIVQSNVAWALLSIANPIIGIASHMLILRVGYLRYIKASPSGGSIRPMDASFPQFASYPMRVQVSTGRAVVTDTGEEIEINESDMTKSVGQVSRLDTKPGESW